MEPMNSLCSSILQPSRYSTRAKIRGTIEPFEIQRTNQIGFRSSPTPSWQKPSGYQGRQLRGSCLGERANQCPKLPGVELRGAMTQIGTHRRMAGMLAGLSSPASLLRENWTRRILKKALDRP